MSSGWFQAPLVWLLPLAFSTAATLAAEYFCKRWALYDHPGERKMQKVPVPRMGGAAFFLTTALFAYLYKLPVGWDLALGGALVFSGGLVDDLKPANSVANKLAFQIPSALTFAALTDLSYLNISPSLSLLVRALIFMLVFFITNAANLMDNMNGLTSGLSLVMLTGLSALAAFKLHDLGLAALGFLLAVAVLGFYVRNFPFGRIYMGDQGSQFLGFSVAAYSILVVPHALGPGLTDIVLGSTLALSSLFFLFIFDVVSVVYIRIREKRSPFQGDQCHISHRLVKRGLNPAQAVLILTFVQLLITVLFVFEGGGIGRLF